MDEFGVLVESIGFRARGNSAPIGKLKPKPNTNTSSFNEFDSSSLPVDELDGVFRSNFNISNVDRPSVNTFGGDDIIDGPPVNQFGGVDLESVFNSSNDWINNSNLNSAASYGNDDLLGLDSKPSDGGVDDLIPGFGGGPRHANNIVDLETTFCSSNTSSPVTDDPFLVFESSVSQSDASWPFAGPSEQDIGKGSVQSSIDVFAMGGVHIDVKVDGIRTTDNEPNSGTASYGFENLNDLDAILGGDNFVQQNPRPSSMNQGSLFGDFFHEEQQPKVKQSSPNVGGDFISLFEDVSTSSREFHEVDGEPKERREARLKHFINVNERMAEAVAQMNERDLRIEREQEEKHRLADTLDIDIKRWAAGKEGNLRALLSSLHQILWPECRWHPASLTDLITSESVKKVYMKANICVHPDKVQQRGANLQQKYLAEKIFDILMEAWNKFRAEELR